MHRFKGLEYQKLAIVGARDGVIPRTAVIERYRTTDPQRCAREELKARSLLCWPRPVPATRRASAGTTSRARTCRLELLRLPSGSALGDVPYVRR
ncbi:hypothetical protein GCM10010365_20530 [Streptomyces poonensis]|uniref:Uncharacterized protein n=1 Tax=Streptomyces poonensis TaxID=68255 RepID=A0A918PDN4_9ACTN|nr:hypothetical protein GCM10010365_20530 [Streptomyces poonensis]GLJ90333.1 hypothetical protein GCM10017589_29360 [Streptomyces poonensis]